MNLDLLRKSYQDLISYIYSPQVYFERVRTFLKEYDMPKVKVHFDTRMIWENATAFIRSIIQLGIIGRERWQYWKLFFWTLFRKPRLFPLAIEFSIYGYHFRKISEKAMHHA